MKTKHFVSNGLILFLFNTCMGYFHAQTNSFPTSGNVGIGTAATEKLTVNGSARIDSTLTVRDSMVVDRTAHIKSDLTVDERTYLGDDLYVRGNVTIDGGDLTVRSLVDTTLEENGVLLVDSEGKVKNGGDLKSLVYSQPETALNCKDGADGNITPAAPIWLNGSGKLYTSNHCVPDIKVGINQNNPKSKLHISTALGKNTHPIIVDKPIQGSSTPYKLMELDNTGLLYAREVKVNLENWPDYVFDEGYRLMPLSELQAFIQQNNHLPNVPSACEMEEQGINLAKSNVMLMEKVEELTLYLLQMKEQLDAQQELIRQLQNQVKP